ncbi:MAG TPA: hypothetical protein VKK61_11935, partial [Tepidisphaeraceae bacterium]|nr:hypothetical protein [Tepidisphaeraceae bacterium]
SMIKARQDLLPGDSFYADAIDQLQVIIDSTKKNIDEDRKKTEQVLTSLQASFNSQVTIEKLPQEQKQLAASLQKQLTEINAARQEYNTAIDITATDPDTQLKSQITTLQAAIEAHRKQLADTNLKQLQNQQDQKRLAAVNVKQVELNKLNGAEAAAKQAYFEKHKQLRDAQAQRDDATANSEKLNGMISRKDNLQRSLEAMLAGVENKQREVNRVVEPIKPTDADITIKRGEDRRLAYTMIGGGLILVIFTGLILWTLHTAAIHAPATSLQSADSISPVSAAAEEEHEPAVV